MSRLRRTRWFRLVGVLVGVGTATCTVMNVGAVARADAPESSRSVSATAPLDRGDAVTSEDLAYQFLDERVDTYGSGAQSRLPRSYEGGFFASLPGGFTSSFVYDDALVILAYLARGGTADVERASAVGDGLLEVQDKDPVGDGRTRASYLPDSLEAGVVEIGSAASYTGNQAWAGMALARLYSVTGERRFLDGALALGEWIQSNTLDAEHAPTGYRGGQGSDGTTLTFKSTEHNIDVTAFFAELAQLTGDSAWSDRSQIAAGFVAAMQSEEGYVWTGTDTDGVTINRTPIPEDTQAWSYLATLDPRYEQGLTWAAETLAATDSGYSGVSFSTADVSKVWFEGTGQLALALRLRDADGDRDRVAAMLESLARAQRTEANGDGRGIVAASSDGLDSGFGDLYHASLHTGATSWYLLASGGVNPFRLDTATPSPSATPAASGPITSATPGTASEADLSTASASETAAGATPAVAAKTDGDVVRTVSLANTGVDSQGMARLGLAAVLAGAMGVPTLMVRRRRLC